MDCEIFTYGALKTAWERDSDPSSREHVTKYFYEHPHEFRITGLNYDKPMCDYRLTLDTLEDYVVIAQLFENPTVRNPNISWAELEKIIKENQDLKKINGHIKQK